MSQIVTCEQIDIGYSLKQTPVAYALALVEFSP